MKWRPPPTCRNGEERRHGPPNVILKQFGQGEETATATERVRVREGVAATGGRVPNRR